jgi:Cys-tRNA(Pro)/Cys-tRNA(Cys) deacylase
MKFKALRDLLSDQNADFEIIEHDIAIKSKKDAMGYFNIEETVPTLIIQTENGFYALIISGERDKVDFELIKKLLGCTKLRMADKVEIVKRFNVEPGQVPLIGHNLPCIIDNLIFKHRYVYGGTGDWFHTLKIRPEDLVKANKVVLYFNRCISDFTDKKGAFTEKNEVYDITGLIL